MSENGRNRNFQDYRVTDLKRALVACGLQWPYLGDDSKRIVVEKIYEQLTLDERTLLREELNRAGS